MMEIKVSIEATELAAAISKLADALSNRTGTISAPVVAEPAKAEEKVAEEPVKEQEAAPAPAPVEEPVMTVAVKPITLDDLCNAGASLIESNQDAMTKVCELLNKSYGVQALNQLDPGQYEAFATDLRKLGAKL